MSKKTATQSAPPDLATEFAGEAQQNGMVVSPPDAKPLATDDPPAGPPAQQPFLTVTITIPFAPPVHGAQGERRLHVDAQLDRRQGAALLHLFGGLSGQNARLAGGGRVIYQADVVRWILDAIAEQIPACRELPSANPYRRPL